VPAQTQERNYSPSPNVLHVEQIIVLHTERRRGGNKREEEGRSLPGMRSCWWKGWWSR